MNSTVQFCVLPLPETDPEIVCLLEKNSGGFVRKDGRLFILADDRVFVCEDTPYGEKLLSRLTSDASEGPESETETHVWKDLLGGKADESAMRKFGIPDRALRCVILFRLLQDRENGYLQDMIPVERPDHIVGLGHNEAALILDMENRSPEEAYEYAAAAAETMESEAGISCLAGVGRTAGTSGELAESYRRAVEAIETGICHKMPGRVFSWDRMAIERLTDLIPSERIELFRKEIFPPQAEKVMKDEILDTVRVFFLNDLNLSTTARQLFIHRNTLLYRMEKIRKATGLDLRKFEDAVVFRLLMDNSRKQE